MGVSVPYNMWVDYNINTLQVKGSSLAVDLQITCIQIR